MKLPSLGGIGKSIGSEIAGGIAHQFKAGKRSEAAARNIGGEIGKYAAEAAPLLFFENGGYVPGKRGHPVKAIVHSGEFILPINAKPTLAQKKIVASNKRKEKKKKIIIA
jgi:hypothetical protein